MSNPTDGSRANFQIRLHLGRGLVGYCVSYISLSLICHVGIPKIAESGMYVDITVYYVGLTFYHSF